jgi:hypothetical protein
MRPDVPPGETIDDRQGPMIEHSYTSTYCLHGLHEDCRLVCKVCAAPCRCDCHIAVVKP